MVPQQNWEHKTSPRFLCCSSISRLCTRVFDIRTRAGARVRRPQSKISWWRRTPPPPPTTTTTPTTRCTTVESWLVVRFRTDARRRWSGRRRRRGPALPRAGHAQRGRRTLRRRRRQVRRRSGRRRWRRRHREPGRHEEQHRGGRQLLPQSVLLLRRDVPIGCGAAAALRTGDQVFYDIDGWCFCLFFDVARAGPDGDDVANGRMCF